MCGQERDLIVCVQSFDILTQPVESESGVDISTARPNYLFSFHHHSEREKKLRIGWGTSIIIFICLGFYLFIYFFV